MRRRMTVNAFCTAADGGGEAVGEIPHARLWTVEIRLPVAADARCRLARHEEFVIDRPVRIVTGRTPVAHRIVYEHPRALLIFVAVETLFIASQQQLPARRPDISAVQAVAVRARHNPLPHGMVVLEHELSLDI